MDEFQPIPGFNTYEINRAGVVRRRLRSGSKDHAPLHVPLVVRRYGRGYGILLVPDDKSLLKAGPNVWRSIPTLRALAFDLPVPPKRRSRYLLATPELEGETWLPVLGSEGRHEVSNLGRVRHARTRKVLKGTVVARNRYARGKLVGRKGDVQVCLSQGAHTGSKTRYVARLVCSAFHGKPERGMEANHIDGEPSNNRADNLEWMTKPENVKHAWRNHHTVSPRGVGARHAKLTAEQVCAIREARGTMTQAAIGAQYGVSRNTIVRILNRTNYQDVT